ncbi:head-tail adaptor protein [Falsigemmobacter faecalis]|uniref:head-tail adaptor protein n=1 Tax=Falsigemmobacter faecalis TaxID=2488730 RepID=UPI001F4450B8|nr:head-tail adaptor protein [Falsigemmobacter faecalis]
MSRRLALEELRLTPDGAGGLGRLWEGLGYLWAEITPSGGRLEPGEGAARGEIPARILTRAALPGSPQRPAPGQRFREGGRVWSILAVAEAGSDPRYLISHVKEEVPL